MLGRLRKSLTFLGPLPSSGAMNLSVLMEEILRKATVKSSCSSVSLWQKVSSALKMFAKACEGRSLSASERPRSMESLRSC